MDNETHFRVPRWSKQDQDFWLDRFESFSDNIVDAIVSDDEMRSVGRSMTSSDELKERMKDAIRTAAELADTAVEEALFRGWVQETQRKSRKRVEVDRKRKARR